VIPEVRHRLVVLRRDQCHGFFVALIV